MERLSKCLPLTCFKTFRTFVLMLGFIMSLGAHGVDRKRIEMKQKSGTIMSPGFESYRYPPNIHYEWVFPYSNDVVMVDFVEMDLYRCYTRDDNQDCLKYDHVLVEHHWPYCNWYKPSGPLSLGPHKETTITFSTVKGTKEACRGRGFIANFKTVPPRTHTTPSTVMPTPLERPTKSSGEVNNDETIEVIIIIATIIVAFSLVAVIVCCCHRKVKNRRRQERERSESHNRDRTNSYSVVPQRGEQTESTELTDQPRHSERSPNDVDVHLGPYQSPRARGPPPSYDLVDNTDSLSIDFEYPPSYESVIRGDLSANRRQSSQRSHRTRDVTHPQRRPDGHNRRNTMEEPRNTTQSRDTTECRSSPDAHNQGHEMDEQRSVNPRSAPHTSLPRLTHVPRTHGSQNDDVDSEGTNERGPHSEGQTTGHPMRSGTDGTRENHQGIPDLTNPTGVSQEDPEVIENQENVIKESSTSQSPDEAVRANTREVFV